MRITFLTRQEITILKPVTTAGPAVPPGQEGQLLGYGPGGVLIPVTMPAGTLPPGQEGQLLAYGPGGTPRAIDPFDGIDLTLLYENHLI